MSGRDFSLDSYRLHHVLSEDSHDSSSERLERLERARVAALQLINEGYLRRKKYYDRQAKHVEFVEGDFVMLKIIRPPNIRFGLYPWYVGPYRIMKVIGGTVLVVVHMEHTVQGVRHVHSDRARSRNGDCAPILGRQSFYHLLQA